MKQEKAKPEGGQAGSGSADESSRTSRTTGGGNAPGTGHGHLVRAGLRQGQCLCPFQVSRPAYSKALRTWDAYPLPVLPAKKRGEPGGPPSITPWNKEGLPPVTDKGIAPGGARPVQGARGRKQNACHARQAQQGKVLNPTGPMSTSAVAALPGPVYPPPCPTHPRFLCPGSPQGCLPGKSSRTCPRTRPTRQTGADAGSETP